MSVTKGPWKPKIAPLQAIDPLTWQGQPVPPREWMVADIIPRGNVTMLSGDGGLGKSLLTMQLLTCAATGQLWLGRGTASCKALGIFCEDDANELRRRQAAICRSLGIEFGDLENLSVVSRAGEDSDLMTLDRYNRLGGPSPFFEQVYQHARTFGAELVVLDSLHDLYPGNENSRPETRKFVSMLRRFAIDINGAVIVNAHPSKDGLATGTGTAGSTAWNNAVRSRLYLTRPAATGEDEPDQDIRLLKTMKANYSRTGGIIEVRYEDGVFVPTEIPGGLFARIARKQAEEVFLECLDATMQQGRQVTDMSNSPRYAPRVFAKMPEADRASVKDLERAMQALFSSKRIRIGQVKGSDRHPVKAIVREGGNA